MMRCLERTVGIFKPTSTHKADMDVSLHPHTTHKADTLPPQQSHLPYQYPPINIPPLLILKSHPLPRPLPRPNVPSRPVRTARSPSSIILAISPISPPYHHPYQ